MANYLYNGVELPALPEYDKETYPYASIIFTATKPQLQLSGRVWGHYRHDQIENGWIYFTPLPNDDDYRRCKALCYYLSKDGKFWEPSAYYGIDENGDVGIGQLVFRVKDINDVWFDHDVYNETGDTIFVEGSDPVPVGGEPEPLPVTPYLPKNGAWVKHDIYKQVGNTWVKQPQGAVEVEGGAWQGLS